jgi:ketosteroid isomerase-like protein
VTVDRVARATACAVAAGAAAAMLAAACSGGAVPATTGRPEPRADDVDDVDLARDLEATVLEGYSQLSLGNFEAYTDTMSDEGAIVFLEPSPDGVLIGPKRARSPNAYRISPCDDVLSKNLEVHLSADRSIGWTFDEVSCRVPDPFEGRWASIPLRVTAVYQRNLDSWLLVMQQVSSPLTIDDALALARAGKLRKPKPVPSQGAPADGVPQTVRAVIAGLITDRAGARERKLATDAGALLLWPGPADEYHGAAIADAPALEELFPDVVQVRPAGMYVEVARNKKLAWAAADLEVHGAGDDTAPLALRATYLLERRDDAPGLWTQVQAHVSVPIPTSVLTKRVFGLELPDLTRLPTPGDTVQPAPSPPPTPARRRAPVRDEDGAKQRSPAEPGGAPRP